MALISTMRNYLFEPASSTAAETEAAAPPAGGEVDGLMKLKVTGKERRSWAGLGSHTKRFIRTTYSLFLVSVVMAIMVSSLIQPLYANPTCILNCAQCVKIYGEFFDGHSCAKVCMESRTKFESFVDCADPTTIAKFLKNY